MVHGVEKRVVILLSWSEDNLVAVVGTLVQEPSSTVRLHGPHTISIISGLHQQPAAKFLGLYAP